MVHGAIGAARVKWQLEAHCRAAAGPVFGPDTSPVGCADLAADSQSQPGAAGRGPRLAGLDELVEDRFQFVFRDSHALVANRRLYLVGLLLEKHLDGAALGRELDGVIQQIAEHL